MNRLDYDQLLGDIMKELSAPRPMRMMFVRGCEWAATGEVIRTASFFGEAQLF